MLRERRFRRALIGALAFAAAMTLGPAAASAAPQAFSYKITAANLDVMETGTWTSTATAFSWDGTGHHHHSHAPDDPDLPPLPATLIEGQQNGIFVNTNLLDDGAETLIGDDGTKNECSGTWEGEQDGDFAVKIKGRGDNLTSHWEIPTGISSVNCGLVYDLFDGRLKIKGKASGRIGAGKIVLQTDGTKKDSEATATTNLTQEVKWEGKVVLKRAR